MDNLSRRDTYDLLHLLRVAFLEKLGIATTEIAEARGRRTIEIRARGTAAIRAAQIRSRTSGTGRDAIRLGR